jgi:uncharacterized membrane protein YgcG
MTGNGGKMKNPLWLLAVGVCVLGVTGCTIQIPPGLAARLYGEPEPVAEPQEPPPPQVVEVVREVVREVEVPVPSEPVVERVVNNYYVEAEPEPVEEVVIVHESRPRTRVSMDIRVRGGHKPPRRHRPRYRPRPRPSPICWPPLLIINPKGGHGGGRGGKGGGGERGGKGERGGRGGKGGKGERGGKTKPEPNRKTKDVGGKPSPKPRDLYTDRSGG